MFTHRRTILLIYFSLLIGLVYAAIHFNGWVDYSFDSSALFPFKEIRAFFHAVLDFLSTKEHFKTNFNRIYLSFILFSIILCFVSIIILFLILTWRRISLHRNEKRYKAEVKIVQELIMQYLYSDKSTEAASVLKKRSKRVVVEQIVALYLTIIGSKAESVRNLFFLLKLDKYVKMRCNNHFWHVRVKYMDIASTLKVKSVRPIAKRYINSSNPLMRTCAIKAYLNLDSNHSFDYLNDFTKPITTWNIINLYNLMIRQSLPVPEFKKYLSSKNASVVCFSLKMIQMYDQEVELIHLLTHKSKTVRQEAVITIRALRKNDLVSELAHRYHHEVKIIKIEIIRTLAALATEEAVLFIAKHINHQDFHLKMEVFKTLLPENRALLLAHSEPDFETQNVANNVEQSRLIW